MKRILAGALLLVASTLTGCESQRFHYTATYNDIYPFDVNEPDGSFRVFEVVSPERVKGALDIPKDSKIESVDIEELSVQVSVEPDNQVTAISVSGDIVDLQQHFSTWNNFPVVLAGVNTPYVGLNALIEEGIARLRQKLLGFISGLDANACQFQLRGDSTPANRRLHVTIYLRVKAVIKYYRCLNVPREVFDGQSCDEVTG